MSFLYLDIETIPAQDAETRKRIADRVKPPGNISKAETIAKWEAEQKPAAIEEAIAATALEGRYGHICSIGWAFDDEPADVLIAENVIEEALILRVFVDRLKKRRSPVIVGHNVAAFDLRFMWQRAFVLGVTLPYWWPRDPRPWSHEIHDTMTMWAGHGGRISLDGLAEALGYGGKGEVNGSMVGGLWAAGNFTAIAEYNAADIELTRSIHRKMLVAYGENVPIVAPKHLSEDSIPTFGSEASE